MTDASRAVCLAEGAAAACAHVSTAPWQGFNGHAGVYFHVRQRTTTADQAARCARAFCVQKEMTFMGPIAVMFCVCASKQPIGHRSFTSYDQAGEHGRLGCVFIVLVDTLAWEM